MTGRAAFGAPPYVEAEVRRIDGDHVDTLAAGHARRFAIGHLPSAVTALLVPGTLLGIHVADERTMTMLGPIEGDAIADLRDPDPLICPVALTLVRAHAADPADTLRRFMAASALVAGTNGTERSRITDAILSYGVVDRALTVGYETDDAIFEAGAIIVRSEMPHTIANAGVGRPLCDIVDHPYLRSVQAVVTSVRSLEGTTRIAWDSPSIRVLSLPEMA